MKINWIAGSLVFFVAAGSTICLSQESDSKNPESTLKFEKTVELRLEDRNPVYLGEIDLGPCPVGSQVDVRLILKNPGDQEIRFNGISRKCACLQFKPDHFRIDAKGETGANMLVRIPARRPDPLVENTVTLIRKDDPVVDLHLSYRLEGLLAFERAFERLLLDGTGSSTVEVPFVTTSPVDPKNIKVRLTDSLAGVEYEITTNDHGGVIKLTASSDLIKKGGLNGDVYLTDDVTKQQDRLLLIVKDGSQHRVSPETIVFHEHEGRYEASAVIRLADSKTSGDFEVLCALGEQKLDVQTRVLADNIISVDLAISAEDFQKNVTESGGYSHSKLDWNIVNGGHLCQLKSVFAVRDN